MNLTCCATISLNGLEFVRFFSEGGTKNEVFDEYFAALLKMLKKKYPQK